MANLNKVMLIGRLTDDPEEPRVFSNGGKVVKFRFAVNNRRKNNQTGQWEDEPVYLDCEVFNRGENGRQADLVSQSLRRGNQVYLEGHLKLDQWTTQDGQKRSRLLIVVDNFQFLERKQDGGGFDEGGSRPQRSAPAPARRASAPPPKREAFADDEGMNGGDDGPQDDIPF